MEGEKEIRWKDGWVKKVPRGEVEAILTRRLNGSSGRGALELQSSNNDGV